MLLACSNNSEGQTPAATPSASPNVAATQAADLRTHLDLLLSEQVMIVAKETAAAVNHSDAYAGYTALLTTNSTELTALLGRAVGDTAAAQLGLAWNSQNGYLVDYAIGVVTHNETKARDAITGLRNTFAPQFAQLVSDATRLPLDPVTQLTTQQVLEDLAFIDDVGAGRYAVFYQHLHVAYAQTFRLGDALGVQIAARFPDKFPGDPSAPAVDSRVSINQLLQEHAYLATMATDAVVAGRTAEKTAAAAALSANADMLGTAFAGSFGNPAGTQLDTIWGARNAALMGYASGDAASREALTGSFVSDFAALVHVDRAHVLAQVSATIKVIDEQRAKSSLTVATDDRAAATSMQPIADSAVEG